MKKIEEIPFDQIIAELLDNSKPFPPIYLHRFSDLEQKSVKALREAWPKIDLERRFNLVNDLDELAQAETAVSFTDLAEIALGDSEPKTRAAAIDLLTTLEDTSHGKHLLQMLAKDPSEQVREHAAIALGFYMYLSELEELTPILGGQIENALLQTYKSQDTMAVRRRCMESLGYSSHKELKGILEKAYKSSEVDWVASALFAMGRSAENRWEKHILKALDRHESEILLEAARAAGELSISDATPDLIKLLEDGSKAGEAVFYATIWALSQIGGKNAREALEKLSEEADEQEDEELISFLEDALENLDFNENMENDLDFLDMDIEEMARGGRVIDLEETATTEEIEVTPDNGSQPKKKKSKKTQE